jgi:hypothetical protein
MTTGELIDKVDRHVDFIGDHTDMMSKAVNGMSEWLDKQDARIDSMAIVRTTQQTIQSLLALRAPS